MKMKKHIYLVILVLFVSQIEYGFSQSANIEWQKCLGGSNIEPVVYSHTTNYIQKTLDGGSIILSNTASNDGEVTNNSGGVDIWVIKLSSSGNLLWQTCVGGNGDDWPNSIIETSDSNFLVLGMTISTSINGYHGENDLLLSKINKNGDLVFMKCIGGSYNEEINYYNSDTHQSSFLELPNSEYLIWFSSISSNGDITINNGSMDICIMQVNQNGNIINTKVYGGSDYDNVISISKAHDNTGY
jgi:hypothetical protein